MSIRPPESRLRHLSRVLVVVSLVLVSSYCTRPDNQTTNAGLTEDEAYLADAMAKISQSRDLYDINPFKSESLFTVLDSTVDTLRIATTVRALEADPDRWLLIFETIKVKLQGSPQGQEPEGQQERQSE